MTHKWEYFASAGPGTLLALGVTDNRHTQLAHVKQAVLQSEALGVFYKNITMGIDPVPADTEVGPR